MSAAAPEARAAVEREVADLLDARFPTLAALCDVTVDLSTVAAPADLDDIVSAVGVAVDAPVDQERLADAAAADGLDIAAPTAREGIRRSLAEAAREELRTLLADLSSLPVDDPTVTAATVGDHFLLLDEAVRIATPTDALWVAVPESTTVRVVHDEHDTVTATLAPGVYAWSLLPRGVDAPSVWG